MLSVEPTVAKCPHASADAVTHFHHGDLRAGIHKILGRGQTSQTGTRHDDRCATQHAFVSHD
jgi:hypothetical protein